jgi:hypothetical protein
MLDLGGCLGKAIPQLGLNLGMIFLPVTQFPSFCYSGRISLEAFPYVSSIYGFV